MSLVQHDAFEAGIFLVDKPAGLSSFKVVSRLRRILRMKKVGHAGTLDPFATGLLVICAGRPATKLISSFMDGEKEYLATLKLGEETETYDTEGAVVKKTDVGRITAEFLEEVLQNFRGKQLQVAPAYSALKHKGKPLYYYARKGIMIEKAPREIHISLLERVDGNHDLVGDTVSCEIKVVCSKGTYIRTLGADIGRRLGCGAHLCQLRRLQSGFFSIQDSLTWEQLSAEDAYEHCMRKLITVEQVGKLLQ